MVTCSPPTGYTCVSIELPQSGSSYLASINFAGTVYTSDTTIYAAIGSNSISVQSVTSGYAFSFWGNSSGLSPTAFEVSSSYADVTSQSWIYLNVYKTSSYSTVTFDTHPAVSGVDFGWINESYHEFTSGQSAKFTQGGSDAVNATTGESYYRFANWSLGGGSITGSPTSAATTVDYTASSSTLTFYVNESTANWAGFGIVGTSGSFASANGSWVQPGISCTGIRNPIFSYTWVGLDGILSSTVEQIGTEEVCLSATSVSYSAWYELYPSPAVTISSITITPGDDIHAGVTYSSSASTITLWIEDVSTGASYGTSVAYASQALSSAECIQEQTTTTAPPPGVTATEFGYGYTGVLGTCGTNAHSLSTYQWLSIQLYNTAGPLSYNTYLSGGSFEVKYA